MFPYEMFQSVEEMKQCVKFPAFKEFSTRIKGDVDEETYTKNKAEFERRMALPVGHPEKWHNFVDYLRFYNGMS